MSATLDPADAPRPVTHAVPRAPEMVAEDLRNALLTIRYTRERLADAMLGDPPAMPAARHRQLDDTLARCAVWVRSFRVPANQREDEERHERLQAQFARQQDDDADWHEERLRNNVTRGVL